MTLLTVTAPTPACRCVCCLCVPAVSGFTHHPSSPLHHSDRFDVGRNIALVPPFRESKVDSYFRCSCDGAGNDVGVRAPTSRSGPEAAVSNRA